MRERASLWRLAAVLALAALAGGAPANADLFSYIAAPDSAYSWELKGIAESPLGKVYDLEMTSQVWQGITWKHQVQVYEPSSVEFPDVVPLLITGGGAGPGDQALAFAAANAAGMRIAALYHIPNQPLFGNLREDALISYTWVKYLETGDETWPALFPMVKATLRAMDTIEALGEQQWGSKPEGFIPFGASKRGWTTYLTGVVAPERCRAIAPMVFDILNLPIQLQRQKDLFGAFSEQIGDYTEKNLEAFVDVGRGHRLLWMVDPYSYRDRLTMPKLAIHGSNDRYWATDAVNLYWPGLAQPKLLLIAPNSGHGLDDRARVLTSLGTFMRLIGEGATLPKVSWSWTESAAGLRLGITTEPAPAECRLWVARSDTADFRDSRWAEQPLTCTAQGADATVARDETGFTAAYGEVVFDYSGRRLYTSTGPRIIGPARQ